MADNGLCDNCATKIADMVWGAALDDETANLLYALGAVLCDRDARVAATNRGLARARARGVQLGRPGSRVPAEILTRVRVEQAAGRSLRAIARGLTADGVPTTQGGKAWHDSTLRYLLKRAGDEPIVSAKDVRKQLVVQTGFDVEDAAYERLVTQVREAQARAQAAHMVSVQRGSE